MPTEWIEKPAEYDFNKTPYENKRRSRGVVQCHCGDGVDLAPAMRPPSFSAQCACGQRFNLVGQQLAPYNQWEESESD